MSEAPKAMGIRERVAKAIKATCDIGVEYDYSYPFGVLRNPDEVASAVLSIASMEANQYKSALSALVKAKQHKQAHGKDAAYEAMQYAAWEAAFKALSTPAPQDGEG